MWGPGQPLCPCAGVLHQELGGWGVGHLWGCSHRPVWFRGLAAASAVGPELLQGQKHPLAGEQWAARWMVHSYMRQVLLGLPWPPWGKMWWGLEGSTLLYPAGVNCTVWGWRWEGESPVVAEGSSRGSKTLCPHGEDLCLCFHNCVCAGF